MPDEDDLETPITLHPLTGEEALRRLLGVDDEYLDATPGAEDDDT